jgi:hypothetical protein
MRYRERRVKGPHPHPHGRRLWEVVDTHKNRVVATGLRLWAAAHKADRLNAWHTEA